MDAIVGAVGGEQHLAQRLAEDPKVEALFVNAVDAAIRTGLESKRRLLARAVAQAVNDEALLDDSMLMAGALAELDVPHVQALKRIAVEWEETKRRDDSAAKWGVSEIWKQTHAAVRAVLVRTGAALSEGATATFIASSKPNRQQGTSDFGLELVSLLEREADPATD